MGAIKDRVPIAGGFLCIVGDPRIVEFTGTPDKPRWLFHREVYRELIFRGADAGMIIVRKELTVPYYKPKGVEYVFTPYGVSGGAFDLASRNDWYWPIMLTMQEIDDEANVLDRYDIVNGCDFQEGKPWNKFVPFMNNVQGIKTVYDKAAWPYYKALCLEAKAKLGDEPFYSTGNELPERGVPLFVEVIIPLIKAGVFNPARFCYGAVMPKATNFVPVPVKEGNRLTYYPGTIKEGALGTMKERAGKLLDERAKLLIYRDVHSFGSPDYDNIRKFGPLEHQVKEMWYGPMGKWCSTDGEKLDPKDPHASKCDVDVDGARISAETYEAMVPDLLGACSPEEPGYKQRVIFEHCPQTADPVCVSNTIRSISRGIEKAGYGVSENRGKHPYVPSNEPDPVFPPDAPEPKPEPKPDLEFVSIEVCRASGLLPTPYCPEKIGVTYLKGSEPTTVCEAHKKPEAQTCAEKYIKNRSIKHWQGWRYILCKLGVKK